MASFSVQPSISDSANAVHPPSLHLHPPLTAPTSERTPRAFDVLVIPGAAGIGPPGVPILVPSPPPLLARPNQSRLILQEGSRNYSLGWSLETPWIFLPSPPARGHWSRKLGSRREATASHYRTTRIDWGASITSARWTFKASLETTSHRNGIISSTENIKKQDFFVSSWVDIFHMFK